MPDIVRTLRQIDIAGRLRGTGILIDVKSALEPAAIQNTFPFGVSRGLKSRLTESSHGGGVSGGKTPRQSMVPQGPKAHETT